MYISRKRFLENAGCAAAGAVAGILSRWQPPEGQEVTPPELPMPPVVPARPAPEPPPAVPEFHGDASFSQAGEDRAVEFAYRMLGIQGTTYLDIGANHPVELNNTYNFYRRGHRGVLVEPNVSLCDLLRQVRPKDTTLAAGIGVTAAKEADYYVMTFPALNTFSKEEAEHQTEVTKGKIRVQKVIKMPLLNVNDVMAEHFQGAPTFLSVDTEGLDLAILKSIDFARFRPKVICAETLVSSTTRTVPEISAYLVSQGYVDRGGSMVNTIFIDSKIL